ncbi:MULTISPECIES: TetR/AcrR family transcriptional regulator [Nocardioides]|nr:TetR family transcriptional regulator [Nocardioides sp. CGMCC 1.13656]
MTTRERIVEAAVAMTTESGWSGVTMAALAERVGVSRQTVYNELGSKEGLAEAVILRELARFLSVVEAAFDAHPDVLVDAIRAATYGVLELAQDNKLLHAVVSATHGADTELLPLLTTHSQSLLEVAKAVVTERVTPYDLGLPTDRLEVAIDVVVRVVLSHVMQPSGPPAETADGIAWLAGLALRGA